MLKIRLFFVFILFLTGCSKQPRDNIVMSEEGPRTALQYYEYDGGMINLAQVTDISTQASIELSAVPYAPRGNDGSRQGAIWDAHQEFCRSWIPTSGYRGGIDGAARANEEIAFEISSAVTQEVLDTCKITVTSYAEISLDKITIIQERGAYTLTKDMRSSRRGAILENVTQPLLWENTYRSLRQRIAR